MKSKPNNAAVWVTPWTNSPSIWGLHFSAKPVFLSYGFEGD
jgi:hypothetical protein